MHGMAGSYSMERRTLNLHFMTCSKTVLASSIALITSVVYANEAEVSQLPTITVNATQNNDALYTSKKVNLSGFQTGDVKKVPASITTITSERIADQHAKTLTDVIKNDSSLGDGYAAIGYYPNFVARGFSLDLGSSYLINGHTIRGEQNVALENKEQVEILKGISAIQSGMSTPGGVVNYVTKRPADIKTITVDANSEGGYTLATDVGGFVNDSFGYRINLAHESIHPNVDHANGKREFGSVALDWKINERSKLLFDIEAQHQSQRSVPGYQLLDGQEVPTNVDQDRLLGYQSWSKPVVNKSLNASLKYQYAFNDQWNGSLSASQSRVVIDDYSAFPWACYSDICEYSGLGNTFDKHGNYDIYDFRSPDDTRITNQFSAGLEGQFNTGNIQHQIAFKLQRTYKTLKHHTPLNVAVGTGNIYQDTIDYSPSSESLGDRYKALESDQTAFTVSDRVQFNDQWSTLLGGKLIHLDEQAYNSDAQLSRDTDLNKFLPQLALMYSPTAGTNLYASYAKGLSDGGEAPWYAETNAYQVLSPRNSEQYELGVKQQIRNFLLTAAIFDLKQDNQYTTANSEGKLEFVEQGEQHNQGIELGLTGALTDTVDVSSGITYTKSRLVDIESDSYKGHQTQNVPKVRATAQLSYKVPSVEGLRLLSGMQYSSSKYANKEGTSKVGGYSVFNIGAAYKTNFSGHDTTFRFNIDNLFNKKYWRDVGAFMGDDYLFLGNPRTAQFSTTFSF
ncbi:TonB-dependent siderophore receptor [Acinetobacter lactucae]|uniref:TonB-dependent siderophore receptor n=1 Tax=Acinetobacter lactucae TaxID=1785128 RepID=UPI000F7B4B51|nr:TonB-dependent siderophore receptor [Acinetobacter lactucae]RSO31623.1 TonB-dependent siderophore receptor [Acinetobacter lactucae]